MADSNFVDYVKIFCASGKGGGGSAHFLRMRSNPRGGPDGGDGGKGGDILLRGNHQLWTLLHLKFTKHLKAGHGESGARSLMSGAGGKDVIIEFLRFCLTYVVTFCLSLILLPFFVEIFKIRPKISAAIVIFICTVISYIGHSRFSFKHER